MPKRARLGTRADAQGTPLVAARMSYAEQLRKTGVVVVPLGDAVIENMPETRQEVARVAHNAPEFCGETVEIPTPASFGALAHPSSFHAPEVRGLRERSMAQLVEHLWRDFVADDGPRNDKLLLEQLFDRLCLRRARTTISGETWHRDVSPRTLDSTDRLFGGWLNLGPEVQYYRFVPDTHGETGGSAGFVRSFSKEDKRGFTRTSREVEVPVGHVVVFYENIVHCVRKKVHTVDEYRLFLGWRLTEDDDSINRGNDGEDLHAAIETQSVMALKSGQRSPMWPQSYRVWHKADLATFSAQFPESLHNGGGCVQRFLPSLSKLGVALHDSYTPSEREMYVPNASWSLLGGDTPGHVAVSLR